MFPEGSQPDAVGQRAQHLLPDETSSDPWVGRCIADSYTLTHLIGCGAVGRVYEATSKSVSRRFAVKIVDADDGSALNTSRAHIEREIEAQGQLSNPHIVQLFDVIALAEGKLAIVMDLVHGKTIRQLVNRDGPFSEERACDVLRQVANGVHEAHEAGLVHRDLKPSNLMIEVLPAGDDFVRIFDFGIVCPHNDVSEDDRFVGTPLYASPEQARVERIDRRSDIYSLGAVLFFILTGRAPFVADRPFQVLLAHCKRPAPRLSDVLPDRAFSDEMEALVARLLAKRREERPATLAQVIAELDALTYMSAENFTHGAGHPSSLGARKSAATVVSEVIDEEEPASGASPAEPSLLSPPTDMTPEVEREDREADVSKCLNDGPAPAARIIFSSHSSHSSLSSRTGRPERKLDPRSGSGTSALIERPQHDLALPRREVRVPESMVGCPWCVTPDGRVVFVTRDGRLRLLDPHLGAKWSVDLNLEGRAISLALAQDRAFVGTLDGEVFNCALGADKPKRIYHSPYGIAVDSLAIDRQGRWLVLSNANGEVRCAGIDGVKRPAWRRIQSDAARVKVDVADDGKSLAILSGASRVLVHSTEWPHDLLADVDLDEPLHCVRLSNKGDRLAAITQQWELGIWQLPEGRSLAAPRPIENVLAVGFTMTDELVLLRTS